MDWGPKDVRGIVLDSPPLPYPALSIISAAPHFLGGRRPAAFLIRTGPRRRRSIAAGLGFVANETGRSRAAGTDTHEALRLDLFRVGCAKDHVEVREHLLMGEVLVGERSLAGVDDALLALVLGFALLGGFLLLARAPAPVGES